MRESVVVKVSGAIGPRGPFATFRVEELVAFVIEEWGEKTKICPQGIEDVSWASGQFLKGCEKEFQVPVFGLNLS